MKKWNIILSNLKQVVIVGVNQSYLFLIDLFFRHLQEREVK